MDTKEYVSITIFSQRLAGHLMTKGYVLMGMDRHSSGNGKNVFFFRDTPQIRAEINHYLATR